MKKGQQEPLIPDIVTNRICDQLTNVCNASFAVKIAWAAAKAQISTLGTEDAASAECVQYRFKTYLDCLLGGTLLAHSAVVEAFFSVNQLVLQGHRLIH